MSSLRRSPLTSIENIQTPSTNEEIELREVNQPLLPTNNETPHSPDEIDETTPFPLNLDEEVEQSQTDFTPEVVNETNHEQNIRRRHSSVRRRRRSTSLNRSTARQNHSRIPQIIREFWADLMPANNRRAWCLPIGVFLTFLIIAIIGIAFVILGFTSVDYDEFGVTKSSLTGVMDLKHPYSAGIHIILPWETMIKFDKIARYLHFRDLTVFTTDQASVTLDATIVYRIRPNQIESIWLNFAEQHEHILRLVAENIIRNYGNQYSIYDYRARREHVEYRLSRILQQTLSGNCCPICCHSETCSKTIEYSCSSLTHCKNSSETCSNGYFVDIDAVYLFKVSLPSQIIKRLHTLMLKPIYTEIAESQENASIIWIETERQRNEYLNKARHVLMKSLAESELIREKARITSESVLLKQLSSSEDQLFNRLNIQTMVDKLSAVFLFQLEQLVNLTQTVDVDGLVTQFDDTTPAQKPSDLFDFVPTSNVFDLTEFLSLLEN